MLNKTCSSYVLDKVEGIQSQIHTYENQQIQT